MLVGANRSRTHSELTYLPCKIDEADKLKILDVNFKSINVLENEELRQGIKEFSDWPTIPQLYLKGEFLGGCDIVKEMYESGELQKKLSEKSINYNKK